METLTSPTRPADKNGKAKRGQNGTAGAAHKALITRNLRLVYDEVAGEPIPSQILDLLGEMDKKQGGGQ